MISHKIYKFCPECQSVMIRRMRRGFIQKHVFQQKPKYRCGNCQAVFFTPLLEKDIKKINEEKNEPRYEKKPTITIEEIYAISQNQEAARPNDDSIEIETETETKKEFQTAFEKGFQQGFEKGFQSGIKN